MKTKFNSILLVDDDTITNFLNENLLQEMKIADHIEVAGDGLEALNFIKKHWTEGAITIKAPDGKLILLDINMSIMNGFEFLDQFEKLEESHKVSVALLTTSVNKKDIARAEGYQVKDYIEKPLNREKVNTLLAKLQA